MSLISRLIKKLFGIGKVKTQSSENQQHSKNDQEMPARTNDHMVLWQTKRNKRIKEAEEKLKDWIIRSITEKGSLAFTWESGNDEAFVEFNDYNEVEQDKFECLEEYIVDKLNIPDAGEFSMNGNGTLYIADNFVKAKYSSTMKGIIDYDEATETEIYSEEELDSGDKDLFAV